MLKCVGALLFLALAIGYGQLHIHQVYVVTTMGGPYEVWQKGQMALKMSLPFARPPVFRETYPDPTKPAPKQHEPMGLLASRIETCMERRRALAAQGCGGRACDLVLVGDSITEALEGAYCAAMLPLVEMETAFAKHSKYQSRARILAQGGDQTPNTLHILQEVAPVLKAPKAFFVMIGTNNIGCNHSDAEQTASGIRAVADALHARYPEAKVLLHPLLPRADDDNPMVKANADIIHNLPWQSTIDRVNTALDAFVRDRGSADLEWVDCTHVFPRGSGEDAKALMPDLLHPNAEGYAKWFDCLEPVFDRVLG